MPNPFSDLGGLAKAYFGAPPQFDPATGGANPEYLKWLATQNQIQPNPNLTMAPGDMLGADPMARAIQAIKERKPKIEQAEDPYLQGLTGGL